MAQPLKPHLRSSSAVWVMEPGAFQDSGYAVLHPEPPRPSRPGVSVPAPAPTGCHTVFRRPADRSQADHAGCVRKRDKTLRVIQFRLAAEAQKAFWFAA